MIVRFDEPGATDVALTGGKGAALARLASRGHPVPEGCVVTTRAFEGLLGSLALVEPLEKLLDGEAVCTEDELAAALEPLRERVRSAPLPEGLAEELGLHVERLSADAGDTPLFAVRSSAVAEDGATSSFAGQYETFLGVPKDGVAAAVQACFASFLSDHAFTYRRTRGARDLGAAVVVQRLVPARAAGVAFTADPVSGDPDVVVVDANHGLGESVVGGHVTPDTLRIARGPMAVVGRRLGSKEMRTELVPGGSRTIAQSPELAGSFALSDDEALAIAERALRIEREEGRAVDVEWAIADGALFVLQSRPVTTTVGASGVGAVPEGFRAELDTPIDPAFPLYSNGNISEVLPGCITPLAFSTVAPTIDHSFRAQLRETGVLVDDSKGLRVVGFFFHRPYLCVSYLAEAARRSPGVSPDRVYEEFVGKVEKPSPAFTLDDLTPAGLARIVRATRASLRRARSLDRDAARVVAEVRDEVRATTPERLASLDDAELAESIRFTEERAELSVVHVWASTFAVTTFGILRELVKRRAGDADGSLAAELVTGLGTLPSADPAFGLYELATLLRGDEPRLSAFRAAADDAAALVVLRDRASAGGSGFPEAFERFLSQHGHRAVCEAEPRKPSWREDPTQVVAMLRNYLDPRVEDPKAMRERRRTAQAAATARVRSELGFLGRFVFDRLVEATRRFVGLREQLKDAIVLRADRARMLYREIARRLVARGLLADPDDVHFLLVDELRSMLVGTTPVDEARERVARRRREHAFCERLEVPKLQEGEPKTLLDLPLPEGDVLTGLGVSPGRVEGRARVILDPRQGAHLEPGEILVAPVTDAGWTPLFLQAAALVVDVGGLLSHGSVVAREYGLPAVVGVGPATRRIRTGDRLLVDATRGTVVLLDA